MEINYKKFFFSLEFNRKIFFESFPPFIFRSVLGMELKKLTCILKKNKCENCDLRFQCAYSKIFESPLKENSEVLKGRNYASHPFVLSTDISAGRKTDKLQLSVTLIGNSIGNIPYIYYALKSAGKKGIFKNRIPFEISDVTNDSNSILTSDNNLSIDSHKNVWKLNKNIKTKLRKHILINFRSPFRIKIGGRYRSDFSYTDFLNNLFRRVKIISGLYGNNSIEIEELPEGVEKEWNTSFSWKDLPRYSARQKSVMKLGGVIGTAEISGKFSPFELSLLDFAEIFHAGKNPSFGLGQIKIFEKKE